MFPQSSELTTFLISLSFLPLHESTSDWVTTYIHHAKYNGQLYHHGTQKICSSLQYIKHPWGWRVLSFYHPNLHWEVCHIVTVWVFFVSGWKRLSAIWHEWPFPFPLASKVSLILHFLVCLLLYIALPLFYLLQALSFW